MKAKEKAEILGDLESLQKSIDYLIAGKSNMIFKTDLHELRNKITDLENKYG